MKIECIKDIKGFIKLKEDWEILFRNNNYSIFQSFEFNYYSWENILSKDCKNKLCIILVTDNNKKCIFPLYINRKKELKFINYEHIDFCDSIANYPINFLEIYKFIRNNLKISKISFTNLCESSCLFKSLKNLDLKYTTKRKISEYSYLNTTIGEFPYNIKHYKSHEKHRIRKALKYHQNKEFDIYYSSKDSFPINEINELKRIMIDLSIRKKNFLSSNMIKLINELYKKDAIVLSVLKENDKIVAINIILKLFENKFLFWIDLYSNQKMLNIANYSNFIKSYSEKNNLEINFGRGRYFYKTSNFAPIFKDLFHVDIHFNYFNNIKSIIVNILLEKIKLIYKKLF